MLRKSTIRVCGITALALLLAFAALGPANWQVRTGLGWQFDHLIGYFGFTLMFCLLWPRPLVVGGTLMASGMLLEALQALTPDRHPDLQTVLYSVAGALAATVFFDLFTRIRVRLNGQPILVPQRVRARAIAETHVREW